MVRFRRDVGSLFTFIKASAILHQALREVDEKGRIVATVADYALAFPISPGDGGIVRQGRSGQRPGGRSLIADRTKAPAAKPEGMRFKRIESAGHTTEVVISTDEIGTATGIGKSAAYRAVRTAIDSGFLINNEVRRSHPLKLVLKKGVEEMTTSLLPDPETIREGGAA